MPEIPPTIVNPGFTENDSLADNITAVHKAREDLDAMEWLQGQVPEGAIDFEFPNVTDTAGKVAGDVAKGGFGFAKQIAGGARDATQEMLDATDSLGDFLSENVKDLGAIQITDEAGNVDLVFKAPGEVSPEETGIKLPEIGKSDTVTGSLIRSITQFLTGFAVGGAALKPIQAASKAGQLGKAAAQGAFSDAFAFDPHEERLSNLVQNFPALENPVTEFLAADPDDGEAEGRFKNAIEGLGLGVAAEGFFRGLKVIKAARAAKPETAKQIREGLDVAGEQVLREVGDLDLLGDTGGDLITKAVSETELPVPTDVAARGLAENGRVVTESGDVFINFGRISSSDDIKSVMDDMASAFKPEIDEARRGVQTNAVTRELADKQDAWKLLMERGKGSPLNAEQSVAARELWASAGDRLLSIAETASKTPTPENLFQFRRMLAVFHSIQKEVIGARTETARALQSWSMPTGGPTEQFKGLMEMMERSGGTDVSRDLADRFALAGKTDKPMGVVSDMADRGVYARSRDAVQEYWVNALLSGPKTHMVNMMSNTSVIGLSFLERAVAARISGEAGVEIGEALAMSHGVRTGMIDALKNAATAFRTGQTGFGLNKIEIPRTKAISTSNFNLKSDSVHGRFVDALGSAVNVPGRALQAEDEFFKTIGYRMELNAQAHRIVMGELRQGKIGLDDVKSRLADIIADPPENVRLESAATAAYQTFTNEGGEFVKGVNKLRSRFPSLRFVLPFVNTPANIFKFTFQRTPLAPLSQSYRAAIQRGGADAALARSRMAIGSTLLSLSYDMGLDGTITGSGPPQGSSERKNWLRQGNQPYSIRIGDKSIAYNRLDPGGFILGMGADIAEYARNSDGEEMNSAEFQELVAATIFSAAENAASKSYMQGAAMLIEAVNAPDRFGASYIERLVSSFVPAIVGEVARAGDPYMRTSHDILSALKKKTPGFTEELPKRHDLWGRPLKYESGLGRAYDVLSPLYGRTMKPEPIDEEMQRSGYFVGDPQRGMTIEGDYVSFRNRPDIYERYKVLQGGTPPQDMGADGLAEAVGNLSLKDFLNATVTGKGEFAGAYEDLETTEQKKKFVQKFVGIYRRAARTRLRLEFPEIDEIADRKKAARTEAEIRRQLEIAP